MWIKKICSLSNVKKTYYYLKKNGIKSMIYASCERISYEKQEEYLWREPSQDELEEQSKKSKSYDILISIVVPTYETKPIFLNQLVESVLGQSYQNFELILADASKSDIVMNTISRYQDVRIKVIKLSDNDGISNNTNVAIKQAVGEYIGLLDHDDLLAKNALFEVVESIKMGKEIGKDYDLIYSDEDKCNTEASRFYEPHVKYDFNLDLLLSNNYICHFTVMKRAYMQELLLRKEYDGAQDYDLVLRMVSKLIEKNGFFRCKDSIYHIPKVLYHWRCHEDSTAQNPASKEYAYKAGKRAIEDFMKRHKIEGIVKQTKHLGFYYVEYTDSIFTQREDVGILVPKVINKKGKIIGAAIDSIGNLMFYGLNKEYSGYMHRASLMQQVPSAILEECQIREGLSHDIEALKKSEYVFVYDPCFVKKKIKK